MPSITVAKCGIVWVSFRLGIFSNCFRIANSERKHTHLRKQLCFSSNRVGKTHLRKGWLVLSHPESGQVFFSAVLAARAVKSPVPLSLCRRSYSFFPLGDSPPCVGMGVFVMSRGYRPVAGWVCGCLCVRGVTGGHSSKRLPIVFNSRAVLITILQIALQGHDPFKNQAEHASERLTENKRLFLFCFSNSYLLLLCILSLTFSHLQTVTLLKRYFQPIVTLAVVVKANSLTFQITHN